MTVQPADPAPPAPEDAEPPRQNRSAEELSMRAAAVAWGRSKWPGARVMHELAVWGRRIDLAFVLPDHLVGVEIKSSRDVLDRLGLQMKTFTECMPEVWVAFAPKWTEHIGLTAAYNFGDAGISWKVGRIIVEDGVVSDEMPTENGYRYRRPAKRDGLMTASMLHILHKVEMTDIARENGLRIKTKHNREQIAEILALGLTGRALIDGVCRALRQRRTGWEADDPIPS